MASTGADEVVMWLVVAAIIITVLLVVGGIIYAIYENRSNKMVSY